MALVWKRSSWSVGFAIVNTRALLAGDAARIVYVIKHSSFKKKKIIWRDISYVWGKYFCLFAC